MWSEINVDSTGLDVDVKSLDADGACSDVKSEPVQIGLVTDERV